MSNEFNTESTDGKTVRSRGTIALIGLVLAGVGVIYLSSGQSAAAIARNDAAGKAAGIHNTIDDFLHGKGPDIALIQSNLNRSEQITGELLTYPTNNQIPLTDLRTNPFRTKANPSSAIADAPDEQRVTLLKSVAQLHLDSILTGDSHRACLINSVLYHEGEQINAFTIDKINDATVVIRSGEYRFELKQDR